VNLKPYRFQRQQFIEQEIVALRVSPLEAEEILDALTASLKGGHDEDEITDILHRADDLKKSLAEFEKVEAIEYPDLVDGDLEDQREIGDRYKVTE
jgi:5'-deoxynucleotidase YfbR-like HD superfamily hydrolase